MTTNKTWLEKGLGKQLLMKMGWKEGEGLGIDGQGPVTNLQVKRAKEQLGLGFNTKTDSAVVTQIQGLSDVLAALQEEHPTTIKKQKKSSKRRKEENDEKSNKQSKLSEEVEEEEEIVIQEKTELRSTKRRGYRKFLDAKDLSLYSKQDLKAILGNM